MNNAYLSNLKLSPLDGEIKLDRPIAHKLKCVTTRIA